MSRFCLRPDIYARKPQYLKCYCNYMSEEEGKEIWSCYWRTQCKNIEMIVSIPKPQFCWICTRYAEEYARIKFSFIRRFTSVRKMHSHFQNFFMLWLCEFFGFVSLCGLFVSNVGIKSSTLLNNERPSPVKIYIHTLWQFFLAMCSKLTASILEVYILEYFCLSFWQIQISNKII